MYYAYTKIAETVTQSTVGAEHRSALVSEECNCPQFPGLCRFLRTARHKTHVGSYAYELAYEVAVARAVFAELAFSSLCLVNASYLTRTGTIMVCDGTGIADGFSDTVHRSCSLIDTVHQAQAIADFKNLLALFAGELSE